MIQKLFDFIAGCPTACHTTAALGAMLEAAGYTRAGGTSPPGP